MQEKEIGKNIQVDCEIRSEKKHLLEYERSFRMLSPADLFRLQGLPKEK